MAGLPELMRPFKIHNEETHQDLPHRSYKSASRAVERTLGMVCWLEVGNTYTVYDARSSKAILQVTRKVDGLRFFEDKPGMLRRIMKEKQDAD